MKYLEDKFYNQSSEIRKNASSKNGSSIKRKFEKTQVRKHTLSLNLQAGREHIWTFLPPESRDLMHSLYRLQLPPPRNTGLLDMVYILPGPRYLEPVPGNVR